MNKKLLYIQQKGRALRPKLNPIIYDYIETNIVNFDKKKINEQIKLTELKKQL